MDRFPLAVGGHERGLASVLSAVAGLAFFTLGCMLHVYVGPGRALAGAGSATGSSREPCSSPTALRVIGECSHTRSG